MKLVERDLFFLFDLYNVKYLNSQRIVKLFGNYSSTMRRLRELERNGYIRRIDFLLNREVVWCLTKKGFNLLNKNYYYLSKTDKINHALACADFYFYLRQRNNVILDYLLDEEISFKFNGKKYKFRPDITLTVDRIYFVEVDLSNKRFEEKVAKWESYYTSGLYHAKFIAFPPIIIVSNNVDKVRSIIDRVKTIGLNYIYQDYIVAQNNHFRY